MWASGTKVAATVVPTSSLYFQNTGAIGYTWGIGDFTNDDAWHTKDISGIVPIGTKIIQLRCRFYDAGTPLQTSWRADDTEDAILLTTWEAGNESRNYQFEWWVNVSANRTIDYKIPAGAINNLDIVILGGFKDV